MGSDRAPNSAIADSSMASTPSWQCEQQVHLSLQPHATALGGDAVQHALSDVTNHPRGEHRVKSGDHPDLCNNGSKSMGSNVCNDSLQQQPPRQQVVVRSESEDVAHAQQQPSVAEAIDAQMGKEICASQASLPSYHASEGSGMAATQVEGVPAPDAVPQEHATRASASFYAGHVSPMAVSPLTSLAVHGAPASQVPLASRPGSRDALGLAQGPELSDRRRSNQGRRLASQMPAGHPGHAAETTATVSAGQIKSKGCIPVLICHFLHLWLTVSLQASGSTVLCIGNFSHGCFSTE